jgi:hypothetical protein
MAVAAFVEILTGIFWHFFHFLESADGAGDDGFCDDFHGH